MPTFSLRNVFLGFQMLIVAFGALVLVPLLTGLNANVALFTAGAGTLLFHFLTGAKVPVFLGSSFAFIAPMIFAIRTWGVAATLSGLFAAGVFYIFLGGLVHWKGRQVLDRFLPPIVTGPVIMLIGLMLAPVAVNLALGKAGDGQSILFPKEHAVLVSMFSLAITLVVSLYAKGVWRLLPVLFGLLGGYVLSWFFGMVRFDAVLSAAWFQSPAFVWPEWHWEAILFLVPVAIAPAVEHFGDVLAISSVTGKNYLKDPGVHRTLIGDGAATCLAAFCGGPPNTTYSEVTGAVALTKAHSPRVMIWAGVLAIVFSFNGKLGALLQSVPTPVMGGILCLLFGTIGVLGIYQLVRAQVDLLQPRNLAIASLILVFGLGGMSVSAGNFALKGVALASIVGVLLNAWLPKSSVAGS